MSIERRRLLGASAALMALLLLGTPALAQITTLDPGAPNGGSLVIGADGLGLISYVSYAEASYKHLKVAHCSNLACTSATLSTLDDSGTASGTSIAVGGDGLGLILYLDDIHSLVKVAHCQDVLCSSAGLSTVAPALVLGSIAVGSDGLGLIAFTTSGGVEGLYSAVFHCVDSACSSATVSIPLIVGGTTGIAIGADGLALISYFAFWADTGVLHCSNSACTASTQAIVLPGNVGSDIVVGGDDRGLLDYRAVFGGTTGMAHCTDGVCSSVTTVNPPYKPEGLTDGPDGLVLGTVYSGSPNSFSVLRCSDAPCATQTVSAPIDTGGGASLRVGADGFPLMAYGGLKVAHCETQACAGETTLAVSDATVVEGDSGTVDATFTVTLSPARDVPVTVGYSTSSAADGASPGIDYMPVSGTLSFAPGTTAQAIVVPVLGDTMDEYDENFSVNLGDTSSGVIADGFGLGTITDDDAPPELSVSDTSVLEGDSGSVAAHFTVSLSAPSAKQINLTVDTVNGTATAPSDYTASNDSLFLPAGYTAISVDVPVLGDKIDEADETFELHILPNPSNATIGDGVGVATILDDDATPAVSIGSATVLEGDSGTAGVQLPLSLSGPSGFTVSVDWQTGVGSGETATPDVDFISASGSVSFAPGQLAQSISASVVGDTVIEPDELFHLQLTNPTHAVLGADFGRVTISDDDAPSLSFDELVHGSVQRGDLQAQPGPVADVDYYRLAQAPFSSWEVVVDGASGDVVPVMLERLAADNVTVLQTGATATGGSSVALRWSNDTAFPVLNQHLSVRSGGCGATCDSSAVYRIRAYDTSGAFARFNNSATQVTVVILENTSASPAQGTLYFWRPGGTLSWSQPFSLAPQGEYVIATATVPALAGASGTITVTSDAPYGSLQGKAVAVEPATGFSFDTPLTHRPR